MTSFWLSVTSSILFILFWLLPISVTILKGKLWMAALAVLVAPVGWFAAIRVAPRLPMAHLPVPAVAGQQQKAQRRADKWSVDSSRSRTGFPSTCSVYLPDFPPASVNYGYVCWTSHTRSIVATAYTFSVRSTSTFHRDRGEHVPARGRCPGQQPCLTTDFIFCGYAARPSKRLVRFMAKKATFDQGDLRTSDAIHAPHPGGPPAGAGSLDHAVEMAAQGRGRRRVPGG